MPRVTWRSRKLFDEPGLWLLWRGKQLCLLPVPPAR